MKTSAQLSLDLGTNSSDLDDELARPADFVRTYFRSSPRRSTGRLTAAEADELSVGTAGAIVDDPNATKSRLLAEWEGFVVRINEKNFEAELRGISGPDVAGEREEAIIPIAEVSKSDRGLLQEGALFRLCVSYELRPGGQTRRYTEIVFRRLPAYRQSDLDGARMRARALLDGLRLE